MKLGNIAGWRVCEPGNGITLPGPERLLQIEVVGSGAWSMRKVRTEQRFELARSTSLITCAEAMECCESTSTSTRAVSMALTMLEA